jgi:CHAT domain-containing protein
LAFVALLSPPLLARAAPHCEEVSSSSVVEAVENVAPTPRARSAALSAALNQARDFVETPEDSNLQVAFAEVRRLLPVSGDAATPIEPHIHFARTLDKWAQVLRSSNAQPGQWAPFEAEAIALFEKVTALPSTDQQRLMSFAHGYRAGIYLRQGALASGLAENDQALLAAITLPHPDLVVQWSTQRAQAMSRSGNSAAALLALRSARGALRETRGSLSTDRYLKFARSVHLPLADLLLRRSDTLAGTAMQDLLHEVQNSLEELRVAEITDFFGSECLAMRSRSRLVSIPRTVILYPIVFPDRIEIIAGKNGQLHRRTVSIEGIDVMEELRAFRRNLEDPTRSRYRASATRFYDWLIRPIGDLLAEEVDTLVFVPMAEWMGLPVAALWNTDSQRFLIEEIAVAITPGLELTDPSPLDLQRIKSIAVGLTHPAPGFPPLAMVGQEIDRVLETFPGLRLDGTDFTTETLEKAFAEHPFDILHIASHGVFDDVSDESFLVTSNGKLSMRRLGEILRPARFRPRHSLKLLVLSACSTAVGSERAAFGLAGVAIQSGAQSALASLWRVNDRAATQLVSKFYAELSGGESSRAEALRRAQRALREDPSFSHPFFWAPFLMINSWL